jgi:hypothetical protein
VTYISLARDTATPLKHKAGPEGGEQETEHSEGSDDEDKPNRDSGSRKQTAAEEDTVML